MYYIKYIQNNYLHFINISWKRSNNFCETNYFIKKRSWFRYAYHSVQRTQDGTAPPVGSFLQVATGLHKLSRLKQEGIATSITAPLGGLTTLAGHSGATSPSKLKVRNLKVNSKNNSIKYKTMPKKRLEIFHENG